MDFCVVYEYGLKLNYFCDLHKLIFSSRIFLPCISHFFPYSVRVYFFIYVYVHTRLRFCCF